MMFFECRYSMAMMIYATRYLAVISFILTP
jgi:hypothetical protein